METAKKQWAGVLVLRAWVEPDGDHGLRVRIIRVPGTANDSKVEPMSSTFATVDGACTMIRVWLEELQHGVQSLPSPESH
jgi:hypothetical protein